MKEKIKRLFFQKKSQKRESLEFPCVLETKVLSTDLKFNALVPDDVSRIRDFDGEIEYFAKLAGDLGPDDIFIDVGAFTGQVSCLAAKICRSVIAIEPDPDFCQRIKRNTELNQVTNVNVVSCGLSDQCGELSLNTSGGMGWAPSFLEKGLENHITVPVKTLDQVVQEQGVCPNVLKIDIEGFEFKALGGARETLSNDQLRAVYIEYHPNLILSAGGDIVETISYLSKFGFSFDYFQPRKNEINAIARRV